MHHYPDAGSASYRLKQIFHEAWSVRSSTQIFVVTRHQYGISALVSQTSFRGETSGGVAKCRLFSQATRVPTKLYQRHVLDGSCAWVRDKVMWYRLAVALSIAAVWAIVHWMLFIFTVTNWRRKFCSDYTPSWIWDFLPIVSPLREGYPLFAFSEYSLIINDFAKI